MSDESTTDIDTNSQESETNQSSDGSNISRRDILFDSILELLLYAGILGGTYQIFVGDIPFLSSLISPGISGTTGPEGPVAYNSISISVSCDDPFKGNIIKYYPDSSDMIIFTGAPYEIVTDKWTSGLPTAVEINARKIRDTGGLLSAEIVGDGETLARKEDGSRNADITVAVKTTEGLF